MHGTSVSLMGTCVVLVGLFKTISKREQTLLVDPLLKCRRREETPYYVILGTKKIRGHHLDVIRAQLANHLNGTTVDGNATQIGKRVTIKIAEDRAHGKVSENNGVRMIGDGKDEAV